MTRPDSPYSPTAAADSSMTLTSAQFHILLALAEGDSHGYGIMQEVERRTAGARELGPGTLYRSIKQLLERGLIAEVAPEGEDVHAPGSQRRTYSLTPAGKRLAVQEARRLRDLVRWAHEATVLEGADS